MEKNPKRSVTLPIIPYWVTWNISRPIHLHIVCVRNREREKKIIRKTVLEAADLTWSEDMTIRITLWM